MVHIDFKEKRKTLHEEIIKAIISLMLSSGRETIVFDEPLEQLPVVLRYLDLARQYEEVKVKAVRYDGKELVYKSCLPENSNITEEEWWSLRENTAEAFTIELYDKLFEKLSTEV